MTSLRAVGEELWIGKERVRPLAKATPEQAMKITCYGSLAFCCDLTRECQLRDQAIELLGISKEDFRAVQNECHQQFLQLGERRWPQEQYGAHGSDYTRSPTFSEEPSHHESFESWRERTSSGRYSTSREAASSSPSSSEKVDLGGLFAAPEEYSSRSLTDPDIYSGLSSRGEGEGRSFSSESWFSSEGGTTVTPHSTITGFCIFCGQDLREDSEFCSRCGRNQR